LPPWERARGQNLHLSFGRGAKTLSVNIGSTFLVHLSINRCLWVAGKFLNILNVFALFVQVNQAGGDVRYRRVLAHDGQGKHSI
jgi:hypothetical protein